MADNQEVLDSIAEQTVAAVQGNVEETMAGFTLPTSIKLGEV
jgi:hypothetical protein